MAPFALWFLALLAGNSGVATTPAADRLPLKITTRSGVRSRVSNIHVESAAVLDGNVTFTYGSCDGKTLSAADIHHTIGTITTTDNVQRLVWILPGDAPESSCISGWDDSQRLVGRSEPQTLHRRFEKRMLISGRDKDSIPMSNDSGIDPYGEWFQGVKLLAGKDLGPIAVEDAKSKDVAIVGAGMAGLTTYLVLQQAGFTNLSIIEASQRLGGRISTEYLSGGPFDYSYQEMGPMRFPWTYEDPKTNRTYNFSDHHIVFQMAEELNRLNNHDRNLSVDFIPWYQTSPNGLQYYNGFKMPNGLPPTAADIQANASLGPPSVFGASTNALANQVLAALPGGGLPGSDFAVKIAESTFKAHAEFLASGPDGLPGDQWSEYEFMVHYLKASLNDTDLLVSGLLAEPASTAFWYMLYETSFFSAASWKTIDGGLNRLPLAFHPIVDNVTTLGRAVERIQYDNAANKVTLQWRGNGPSQALNSSTHDYAVVAVPFSAMRTWRLPGVGNGFSPTITNAINTLNYDTACKVALEFSARFWEQPGLNIVGSCATMTDIPGIGQICYPSYDVGGKGPASILASFDYGQPSYRWLSFSEEEHVRYVLDAMVEIHGEDIRGLYTGKYRRKCWLEDPYTRGGWASPTAGQHELYMPEYFKTHGNVVFVGEHTAQIHAWIGPAIESGIRGAVQLMLELGLVDEAHDAVDKWMARWIDIVSDYGFVQCSQPVSSSQEMRECLRE